MTSYRHSELFSLFWFDSVSKWHCDLRWAHPGPSGMSSSDRRWRSKFPSSVGERGAIKDGNSAAVGQQHLLWLWVPASHRKGNFHSVQNIAILNWLFKPSKKKRSTFLYTRTFFMLIQKYWHLPNNIKTISYINMAPNDKSKSQKEVKHKSNTQCVNIPCQNKGWAQLVSTKLLPDNAGCIFRGSHSLLLHLLPCSDLCPWLGIRFCSQCSACSEFKTQLSYYISKII